MILHTIIAIIGILFTILFIVGTHEFAHFFTARLLGVKVLCFSIGFGKKLFSFKDKKGTSYVFSLIPLGGYVKMLDENEGEVLEEERNQAYNRQPFYKKFLIVLAGPSMNILCALLLYWIVFMVGFVTIKPVIGSVIPQSIAAEEGLKPNQVIISVDNHRTSDWTSIIFRLLVHIGNQDSANITVQNLQDHKTQTHRIDLSHWTLNGLTPDPLKSLGIVPYEPTVPLVVGFKAEHSPAQSSELRIGDMILAINKIPVENWDQLLTIISNHPNQIVSMTIKRGSTVSTFPVQLGVKRNVFWQAFGYLGIGPHFSWPPQYLQKTHYGPFSALIRAGQEITDFTYFNLMLFVKMVTGKLSLQSLGGPITIFETAGEALNVSFLSFISFLAFLSIAIGIINFLPIPGLDGGHLFIQTIEWVIRRPIPLYVLGFFYRMGFLLIFFLLIQAIVNDVLRLI